MEPMILIISNAADRTVDVVTRHLEEMGERFYRFNTETFPSETRLTTALSSVGVEVSLGKTASFQRASFKSVWYRRPVAPVAVLDLPEGYRKFVEREAQVHLWSLYTTLDAFWINPPLVSQHLLEHNKLYQLRVAASVGLQVPDTIITNNGNDLMEFCRGHGGVIAVKTMASHFFGSAGSDQASTFVVYTNRVTEEELARYLGDIELAPVLAQAYIDKELELRVTIVGDRIFACAIHSQDSERTLHDWRRYDFDRVKHEPHDLPREVEEKLLEMMRMWGLSFGAVDMIITPDGDYVFLEINPNGQWAWIEALTGMPISRAIAELLANPPTK